MLNKAQIIILSNDEFKKLADNYYSEQLPNRFIELLADIALLHGESFNYLMSCYILKLMDIKETTFILGLLHA